MHEQVCTMRLDMKLQYFIKTFVEGVEGFSSVNFLVRPDYKINDFLYLVLKEES